MIFRKALSRVRSKIVLNGLPQLLVNFQILIESIRDSKCLLCISILFGHM